MGKIHLNIEADSANDLQNTLQGLTKREHSLVGFLAEVRAACKDAESEPDKEVATATPIWSTFGVNVYESSQHAFALGRKLYDSKNEAECKAYPRDKYIDSFELRVDAANNVVDLGDGINWFESARYFAFDLVNQTISRGYNTRNEAADAHPGSAIFGVAVNDDEGTARVV